MLKLNFPAYTKLHGFQMIIVVYCVKYSHRPISLFANSVYCILQNLDKNHFWKQTYLQNISSQNFLFLTCCGQLDGRPALLQVRTVDRAVDRSSDRWVYACVHVVLSTGRSIGPHVGRPGSRPTDCTQLSVWDGRPGGRPEPANGQKFLKTGRPWVFSQPNG